MEIPGFYPFKQAIGEKKVFGRKSENDQSAYEKNQEIFCEEAQIESMSPKKQEAARFNDKPRWTAEEDHLLLELYTTYGAKWHQISLYFNHRPSSSVKNHFYRLRNTMTVDQRNAIKETLRANKAKCSVIANSQMAYLLPEHVIKNDLEISSTGNVAISDLLIQNLEGSLNNWSKNQEFVDKHSKLKILRHWESILNNLVQIKKTELGIDHANL